MVRRSRSETATAAPYYAAGENFLRLPPRVVELALDGPGVAPGAVGAHHGDRPPGLAVHHPAEGHDAPGQVSAIGGGAAAGAGDHPATVPPSSSPPERPYTRPPMAT